MDIAATATALSQVTLQNNVSVAVARKAMDAQKAAGDAAIQLLRAAAENAGPGPSPDGVGTRIDAAG
ncbi:MAG TPA: YjfB family protein [Phycisphaerales bacterium]|nr:YjfB family protein [Phycisphaerales bacterium]